VSAAPDPKANFTASQLLLVDDVRCLKRVKFALADDQKQIPRQIVIGRIYSFERHAVRSLTKGSQDVRKQNVGWCYLRGELRSGGGNLRHGKHVR
jgi:hypothetical protein